LSGPDNVKEGLEIIAVSHVDEVLEKALTALPAPIEWTEEDDIASQPHPAASAPVSGPTAH
jgi:ATP-dependent Lon protease